MAWFQKILLLFKVKDLRKKILFILAIFVIFRVAANIPIPGIDTERLRQFVEGDQFLGLLNIFTGGTMSRLSIVMLGLGPYITASIIMQLLTMIFPSLREMYQESGEQGRQKFNQYSRLLTVPLGAVQGYGMIRLFTGRGVLDPLSLFNLLTVIAIVTAGTVFLMWLGELISEKGLGNGASLLIFAGIIARLPSSFGQTFAAGDFSSRLPTYIGFLAIGIAVIAGVVIITEAQRNIPVSYAKRIRGRKIYGGVSTHLPIRVNSAGVIPIIFALSIMLFPSMIKGFLGGSSISFIAKTATALGDFFDPRSAGYAIFYFILVVLFTYFYTAVTFDPKAISGNLQKSGGFIPGIRPGEPTAGFLYFILNRITLIGALFLGAIAVLPMIVQGATGITTLTIGGTALLIVVSVVLESMKQAEAQLVMRDYEGF